jgi:hypothetical protein
MLTLAVILDKERYAAGQPIAGRLVLANAGETPLLVNTRLAINKHFAPAPFREVHFELDDPAGERLEFQLKVNVGEPRPQDFKDLGPGESSERGFDLDSYFLIERPGRYSLRAVYSNQAQPDDGRQAWTGKLESEAVTFDVKP